MSSSTVLAVTWVALAALTAAHVVLLNDSNFESVVQGWLFADWKWCNSDPDYQEIPALSGL
jgi:hypothetical protein